jgi:predicted RNase H-like HicB family nuclease
MRYPIAIEIGDEKTAYGVVVPDLPGCFSAGDTLDEAISNSEEAMLLWFHEDEPVAPPAASKIEDLRKRKEFKDRLWVLVSVDLSKLNDKAVRINVTIPERILHNIDAHVSAIGESRSGFLTRAAMATMATEHA